MKVLIKIAVRIFGLLCIFQLADNPVLDGFKCLVPRLILQGLNPHYCHFWASEYHLVFKGLRNFANEGNIDGIALRRQTFIANRLKYLLFIYGPISLFELFEAILWNVVLQHFHFLASAKGNQLL